MLRISWQTLRARRATLAGAFAAIFLAVTLAYATGMLMAGALSAPGPGRLAAADVVLRARGDRHPRPGRRRRGRPGRPGAATACRGGRPRCRGARSGACRRRRRLRRGRVGCPWTARRRGWRRAPARPRLGQRRADPVPAERRPRAHRSPRRRRRRTPRRAGRAGRPGRHARAARATYRVTGVADGRASRDRGQAACSSPPRTAEALSGTPERVNAIGVVAQPGTSPSALRTRLRAAMGPGVDVLDAGHGADADAGDPQATDREDLIAIFGVMGGIAGAIALFVVAGTFALAIAQRRRETAVLRALGATPRQVRRLLSAEALILSVAASALGLLAGGPLAHAIVGVLADHGVAPDGFEPGALVDPAGRRPGRRHRHRAARRGRGRAPRRPRTPERGAARGRDRARPPRLDADAHGCPLPRRRDHDVDHLLGRGGAGLLDHRRHPARDRNRAARPGTARSAGGRHLAAVPAPGCPRAAREHEPGRQPLAHGSAGDPDRPDRHARRHSGRPAGELAAARRAGDRGARDRGPRRGRARRRAAAGRHRGPARPPARRRRCRRSDADERLPARQGPRLGHAVGGGGGRGARHRPRARPPRHERQPGRRARIGRRGEQRGRDGGPPEGGERVARPHGRHPGRDSARRCGLRALGRARRRRARCSRGPAPREHARRRCRVRRRRPRGRALARPIRRCPPGHQVADPRGVPHHPALLQQRGRVGRVADHRAVGDVRRTGADQHRGHVHRRAPGRAGHDPSARWHRRPGDAHGRARARAGHAHGPRRRGGDCRRSR